MDARGWFGIPYLAWAALCLAVALVWVFVWPQEQAANATGLRYFLMRWGHALVWLLLAANCLMKASIERQKSLGGWRPWPSPPPLARHPLSRRLGLRERGTGGEGLAAARTPNGLPISCTSGNAMTAGWGNLVAMASLFVYLGFLGTSYIFR